MGHVVLNADGEAGLFPPLAVGEHGGDLPGGGVLGAQAVAPGVKGDVGKGAFSQGGGHVQPEGLSHRAGLLGAVQHRNGLRRLRDGRHQPVGAEGAVEPHLHHSGLFPLGVQVVHRLLGGVADRPHGHDDLLGVGGAVVVKEVVIGARGSVDLFHLRLHHLGEGVVKGVGRLPVLEEDVGVLGAPPQHRPLGVEGPAAKGVHRLPVHHLPQGLPLPDGHLLNFVRGAKPVKVDHRHPPGNGREVGHRRQVHHLLGVLGAEHGRSGLAADVDVRVVAEDGEGVAGHCPGRHVDHPRQQFPRHLVEVGQHQQQPLGGGVGGRQRPRRQGAVHRSGGAPPLPAFPPPAPAGQKSFPAPQRPSGRSPPPWATRG